MWSVLNLGVIVMYPGGSRVFLWPTTYSVRLRLRRGHQRLQDYADQRHRLCPSGKHERRLFEAEEACFGISLGTTRSLRWLTSCSGRGLRRRGLRATCAALAGALLADALEILEFLSTSSSTKMGQSTRRAKAKASEGGVDLTFSRRRASSKSGHRRIVSEIVYDHLFPLDVQPEQHVFEQVVSHRAGRLHFFDSRAIAFAS